MTSVPAGSAEWTTYDEFAGPDLDSSLWQPVDLGSGPRVEPEARITVEHGVLTVDVPRFRNCDPDNQGLDNTKHLVLTTQGFRLPPDGVGRFSVELHAENFDASGDYRHGFASFTVVDIAGRTNMVFNMLSNGDRVFAEHEVLEGPGQEHPFTRIIEDPFFLSRAGSPPACGLSPLRDRDRQVARAGRLHDRRRDLACGRRSDRSARRGAHGLRDVHPSPPRRGQLLPRPGRPRVLAQLQLQPVRSGIETHLITSHLALPLMLGGDGELAIELATARATRPTGRTCPTFDHSETPHLLGRGIAALAADADRARSAGQCLGSWELIRSYEFTAADGACPDWAGVDREAR